MAIEIVDFSHKKWWIFPELCKRLPEGIWNLGFIQQNVWLKQELLGLKESTWNLIQPSQMNKDRDFKMRTAFKMQFPNTVANPVCG